MQWSHLAGQLPLDAMHVCIARLVMLGHMCAPTHICVVTQPVVQHTRLGCCPVVHSSMQPTQVATDWDLQNWLQATLPAWGLRVGGRYTWCRQ